MGEPLCDDIYRFFVVIYEDDPAYFGLDELITPEIAP